MRKTQVNDVHEDYSEIDAALRPSVRLKALLDATGRTQANVARKVHCATSYLCEVMNGRRIPATELADRILVELGGQPDDEWHQLLEEARQARKSGPAESVAPAPEPRPKPPTDGNWRRLLRWSQTPAGGIAIAFVGFSAIAALVLVSKFNSRPSADPIMPPNPTTSSAASTTASSPSPATNQATTPKRQPSQTSRTTSQVATPPPPVTTQPTSTTCKPSEIYEVASKGDLVNASGNKVASASSGDYFARLSTPSDTPPALQDHYYGRLYNDTGYFPAGKLRRSTALGC